MLDSNKISLIILIQKRNPEKGLNPIKIYSKLLKYALPPPLPDSDSAGHVGCIDGRGRGGVFRSDDITAPRSKCCKVLFRHTFIVIIFSRLENRHILLCVAILTRVTTHVNVFK